MPCTWHETGLSVWGRIGDWRYEAMVIPALNANMFNHSGWIHDGSASAYEFKVANNLAGAARIDNYSVKGLRMGISGYIGNSFQNDIIKDEKSTKYKDVKGTVVIGAFDFDYNDHNWVVRGNFDYGHLGDADLISTHNKSQDNSTQSPYPHTAVGKTAIAAGIEAGYDIFSQVKKMRDNGKNYMYLDDMNTMTHIIRLLKVSANMNGLKTTHGRRFELLSYERHRSKSRILKTLLEKPV